MYRVSRGITVIVAVALMVVAAIAVGCGSEQVSTDPVDLNGSWMLATYRNVDGDVVDVDPEVNTELTMADGKSNGVAGVNTFTGSYEASEDGSLTFGPQAATAMAGPPAAQAQETAFFKILEEVTQFETDGTVLTLRDSADDELATFDPVGAPAEE